MASRPKCPDCGRELVFAAITLECVMFQAWICDCADQPDGVAADIVRAREWDDFAMLYELEVVDGQSS